MIAATPAPLVMAPATFARVLEVARAALAGAECVTLTLRHGLVMPRDRLDRMIEAVAGARAELDVLEQWPAGSMDGARLQ